MKIVIRLREGEKEVTILKEDGTVLFTVPNTDVDISYALDASKTIYEFDEIEVQIAGEKTGAIIGHWSRKT